jgi:hypothetical protein
VNAPRPLPRPAAPDRNDTRVIRAAAILMRRARLRWLNRLSRRVDRAIVHGYDRLVDLEENA